jgi:Xaa-Pro aminopeptidase
MLSDLDALMRDRGIDAAIVPMHEAMHSSFRWLSRGAKVTRGYAIKVADREPLLVTYPMEREEAKATGLEVRLAHEFDYERIFRSAPDQSDAYAQFFGNILRELHAKSVAFFGNVPVQLYIGIVEALQRRGVDVHRSNGEDLIQLARKRKEPREVEAIRSVGERTEQVVDGVRAMLRDASPSLTLGDLKRFVSSEISRLGMIEDHETILSQGRDAGVPHSRGDASARVVPSQPIVLDIFPADRTSGYFFDLTRTFCIGPIPDELQRMHEEVLEAFTRARDAVRPGTPAASYQSLVCDFFEERGHATLRSNPKTLEGYVHSLGHGVGLDIHEKPSFSLMQHDAIEEGDVITIEPGLYYPDRGLGVRIEDTFVVTADGVETMCRGGYGLRP